MQGCRKYLESGGHAIEGAQTCKLKTLCGVEVYEIRLTLHVDGN